MCLLERIARSNHDPIRALAAARLLNDLLGRMAYLRAQSSGGAYSGQLASRLGRSRSLRLATAPTPIRPAAKITGKLSSSASKRSEYK
jgi:hypothetical protein